jgi:choline dehydrogenase-like flavoprotein
MLLNGIHFRLFGSGPILSAGVEAGAFVNPTDPEGEPTIQAFCVPIVYLDRDTLTLVQDTMMDGQRFFLRAFTTSPLKERIKQVAIPDPNDLSDEALMKHCRRFVKTNYHPAGTCRMGTASDSMAVLDSRLRVRGIDNLRICDLSAMPNINAGNTNAPAMMMGSRCAELITGRPTTSTSQFGPRQSEQGDMSVATIG